MAAPCRFETVGGRGRLSEKLSTGANPPEASSPDREGPRTKRGRHPQTLCASTAGAAHQGVGNRRSGAMGTTELAVVGDIDAAGVQNSSNEGFADVIAYG